jgi:hypothetical protein
MQVFSPGLVLALKLGALSALLAVIAALFAWRRYIALEPAIGDPVTQVVPFSHKHHVGDDGIDCRYCHTSVGNSAFAGIPPLSTCMTCHSQLFTTAPVLAPLRAAFAGRRTLSWNRVYDLPDFVYFDHSIHIAKGIGCSSCHGRVDEMPLTERQAPLSMQWCLGCHRNPEDYLRPPSQVFNMRWRRPPNQRELGQRLRLFYHLHSTRLLTSCSTCHR